MGYPERIEDRRTERRFSIKEGAFTINSTKPGLIVDVSLEGLSFRYVDRKRWPLQTSELDIIVGDYEFYLPKVSYEVVYDTVTPTDFDDKTLIVKKCGVKFRDLSAVQQRKLEHFIASYNCTDENEEMLLTA